jgi:hypothetical protein
MPLQLIFGRRRHVGSATKALEHILWLRRSRALAQELSCSAQATDLLGHSGSDGLIQRNSVTRCQLGGENLPSVDCLSSVISGFRPEAHSDGRDWIAA